MQSETQTVRKDSSVHPSAPKVRHQSAIGEPISIADDYKTFRAAVVIGLVMVAGLSLFLPDKEDRRPDDMVSPVSVSSLDVAQHASTDSERTQTNIVELHQGNEIFGHSEIGAQLATLAQVVQSSEVVKRQASTPTTNPVVRTPPFQTDANFDRLKSQVEFRGPAGQVGFRGPARQAHTVSLQR